MSWPTGPPPMPPPGWYDDPEQAWTWRYWDGAYWSEHRAPMWVPPVRDPMSLSAWFEQSIAAAKIAVRRVGLVLGALWLALGAAGWWLVVASLDSARGRELRRLLENDPNASNPIAPSGAPDLTDAELDRAWELTQDIFWSALPWLALLAVAFIVASAWSIALVAQAAQPQAVTSTGDDQTGDDQPAHVLGTVTAGAIRRVPAVLGAGAVLVAVNGAAWAVGALPLVIVALAAGGAAAFVLTAIFVVPLVFVVTAWLWGRLTLASVIAAAGGHGIGVRRSWEITYGRFWYVAGRLLVTAMIAGVAGAAVNAVTGVGQFLGFAVFLAIVLLLQALAFAISIVVTTCGHLAAIDQLVTDGVR